MLDENKIFLKIIQRFITFWREAKEEITAEEVRKQFSRVKIMKLFYFFCLLDIEKKIRNKQYFGDFEAYPYGPVNVKAYTFLKSNDGDRCVKDLCEGKELNLDLQPTLAHDIEGIFTDNEEKLKKLAKMPVDELVDLSHTALSWRNAYLYSDKPEMNVELSVEKDRQEIEKFLSTWKVA